jgi:hypothetical protein
MVKSSGSQKRPAADGGKGGKALRGGHIDITRGVYARLLSGTAVRFQPHNLRYVQVAIFLMIALGASRRDQHRAVQIKQPAERPARKASLRGGHSNIVQIMRPRQRRTAARVPPERCA